RKNNQNLPGMGGIFNHINCNLYAYGANNPVHYIDPDGNQSLPCISPREFFSFICKNDPTAKAVMTAGKAAEGDPVAQQLMKEASAAAGKEMAANGLEATANAAEVIGDAADDLAIAASFVEPEVAAKLGLIADVAGGTEVAARAGKAAITGDKQDLDKAKDAVLKKGESFFIGRFVGKKTNDTVGCLSGKAYEKVIDKVSEHREQQDE
ncbi:MAG: hypothetical protein PUK48_08710, partial [Spirochaetales bacterium]|nr:hypothetical protein [Spirochaetales bacterium]